MRDFTRTMQAGLANCTETPGFLEYEAKVLQKYYRRITGPEKGCGGIHPFIPATSMPYFLIRYWRVL